jgi:small conductance mechanosensitive channel
MNPLFAQAAADTTLATNRSVALLNSNSGLVARFEEATGLPREVAVWSVNIVAALVILVAGWMVAGFARGLIRQLFAKRNIDSIIGGFVGNLVHAAIMAFVIVTVLGQVGVDTKSFAAIIAAAGLAIGFALQGGLSNFAAGFLIIVFRPFKAGDVINGAGIEGTVEEVQVFSTTLNTADHKRIIVPNAALMSGTITNYTANDTRRVDLQLAVGATQDLAKAHATVLAMASAEPRILKNPPPSVANAKLIDGGTLIELRVWCKTPDFAALSSDLVAKAPAALVEAGVKGPDKTVYYMERK